MSTLASSPVNARFSFNGKKWCFGKFIDQSTTELIVDDGVICGHVDPEIMGELDGREINVFSILLSPNMGMLKEIFRFIGMDAEQGSGGGSGDGNGPFYAGMTLDPFEIVIDKVGAIHRWEVAWLNRLVLRGQVGTVPISVELQCVGKAETEIGSFTAPMGDPGFIYGFPNSLYTIDDDPYLINQFAVVIDRNLVSSWNADIHVTDMLHGKRDTLLATSIPYTAANKDVYWLNKRPAASRDIDLKITNGLENVFFRMPLAKMLAKSPSIESAVSEIRLPHTWRARRDDDPVTDAFSVEFVTI